MRKIWLNRFPQGRTKSLTMSYDDGRIHDLRLAEIFDKNEIKATFHLNTSFLGKDDYITKEDVRQLAKKHEISGHSYNHPHLETLPLTRAYEEVFKDRVSLEAISSQMIRGMSYPFGSYSEELIPVLQAAGMEYSRTTISTNYFKQPEDYMKWHPTTHHNGDLNALWKRFTYREESFPTTFYIWGHSYEFENDKNWDKMEEFCKMVGGHENIWYATNWTYVNTLDTKS